MKLIIRADDIGYSEAVNYGIEKSVKDGLIRSAGLMPNMPYAAHGLKLLEGTGIAIGQHTNMCLERPCADPALIPSLVDEKGYLKSSRVWREAFKNGEDFAEVEEAVIEIEAQYQKFLELVGHEPSYFEAHAVLSDNLNKALAIVAERHGLKYQPLILDGSPSYCGKTQIVILPMESAKPDYDPFETLKKGIENYASEEFVNVFICHPGYVDDYLMKNSSLNLNRTKETAMLCDPAVKEWLEERNIELISYDDIG